MAPHEPVDNVGCSIDSPPDQPSELDVLHVELMLLMMTDPLSTCIVVRCALIIINDCINFVFYNSVTSPLT